MAHSAEDNPLARAISEAVAFTYDRVYVHRTDVLRQAAERGYPGWTWEDYQQKASGKLMDEIAEHYVRVTKITVAGAGALAGIGGLPAILPDALQFIAMTLRMTTGVAAAYGFDPDPDSRSGQTRGLVLQAYLNANLGASAYRTGGSVTLSTAAKLLRHATTRANWILDLLLLLGRVIGLRITRQGILRTIPFVASGTNAGFNWYFARQIARSAKEEFRQFREDLWRGKHRDDPDFDGLGGRQSPAA